MRRFPLNDVATVTDEAEAKTIMLELGIIDLLVKRNKDDTSTMMIAENHPTRWCLCARFWDNPDPTQNGYMVVAFPKAQFSREQASMMIPAFHASTATGEAGERVTAHKIPPRGKN